MRKKKIIGFKKILKEIILSYDFEKAIDEITEEIADLGINELIQKREELKKDCTQIYKRSIKNLILYSAGRFVFNQASLFLIPKAYALSVLISSMALGTYGLYSVHKIGQNDLKKRVVKSRIKKLTNQKEIGILGKNILEHSLNKSIEK